LGIVELDDFAKRYGKGVFLNAGVVSHQVALEKAMLSMKSIVKKL